MFVGGFCIPGRWDEALDQASWTRQLPPSLPLGDYQQIVPDLRERLTNNTPSKQSA
jgi:hypothetical protein